MAFDWQVEASQSISWKTICSSLEQNGIWPEVFNDFGDDRLEDHVKTFIIKSLIKREVDSMIGAWVFSNIINVTCSWEIILELMERASHDPVSEVEGFFNTISMMNIDINVENSLKSLQQL